MLRVRVRVRVRVRDRVRVSYCCVKFRFFRVLSTFAPLVG